MYAKLALREVLERRTGTALAVLAIGIATASLILLGSFSLGLREGSAALYDDTVDYWVLPEGGSAQDLIVNTEKTMLGSVHRSTGDILSIPGVSGATPVLNRVMYASKAGSDPASIFAIGIIPGNFSSAPFQVDALTPGDPYYAGGDFTGEVIINDVTSGLLGIDSGDYMNLNSSGAGIVSGRHFRVVKVISTQEYSTTPVVVLHISELQELTGNRQGDRANYIVASGKDVGGQLRSLFPGDTVLGSAGYVAYAFEKDRKLGASGAAAAGVSLVISALFISTVMILSISERQKEIAVMRAMGISRGSVAKMLLFESLILSLLGGFTGILLSFLGRGLIEWGMYSLFGMRGVASMHYLILLFGLSVAVIAGMVSSIVPFIAAERIRLPEVLG
ncbi:MAG TPA: ABC transporter permease [Candidatus Methanoperedenaceae archaeon]|nr:ABC transporter permease [Candidatus Methanoperedenaceae archaeon]